MKRENINCLGFTLVEALVALLVLSIGLLGVVAMQLNAVQSAHVAYQRSVATLAAQDAVERLWASASIREGKCDAILTMDDWDVSGNWPDWYDVWSDYLPGINDIGLPNSTSAAGDECRFDIDINWQENRLAAGNGASASVSTLKYVVKIPAVPGETSP
ncbi:type IV pilus modification protein PilV [Halomonas getboli]|uniref:type IV pilus modification protein PilV n=1 Tax=Halomonas getboli TaxID=2935862 RepID=UPI0020000EFD|nr:type IV pilus modification protein PilV [Halomonas getboli]